MTQIQTANLEQMELLASEFQRRYETQFALANALSLYTNLAVIRGFWPCSRQVWGSTVFPMVGDAIDGNHLRLYGSVYHLAYSDATTPTMGIAPWVWLDGASALYVHSGDAYAFKITGSDVYIGAGYNGLTMGAWVRFDNTASTSEAIIWKGEGGAVGYAYGMHRLSGSGYIRCEVWNGSNNYYRDSANAVPADTWTFICGRFKPSTSVQVTVNDTTWTNSTGIPSTINNISTPLSVGARAVSGGSYNLYLIGRLSMVFITASYLPDDMLYMIYSQTRAMFGV